VKQADDRVTCAPPTRGPDAARPIAVIVDREGLGDVMLKRPFLMALRRAWPEHEVWWIAKHQSSMEDELRPMFRADVAQVMTWTPLEGRASRLPELPPFERVFDARTKISAVAEARARMKHGGFYCCLPGYFLCDGRPPSRMRPRHIGRRMTSLIECATGAPAPDPAPLQASAESSALARSLLPEGPSYVGIAPGSREAAKNWPIDRYLTVARTLAADALTPVVFLGPMEPFGEAEIRTAAPGAIVLRAEAGAAPGVALDRLVAQGQRLAVLLANDNGVGHLLGAAGVPVVSLFGPSDPARWAPTARDNLILSASEFGGAREIAAIPADAVVAAVRRMLERERARSAAQAPPAMKS
jgi:ADP-heptose:LPS heptosyltransferase